MNFLVRAANGAMDWVNERAPALMPVYRKHMTEYYAPKNFNLWYYFGVLSMLVLVNQIVTGIYLTMFYKPSAVEAFASVEYIMRDVSGGWLIRYMHSTGASLFFIVIYLHMFRALIYGSHQKPRELVWILGMLIFLCLMAEAFMGYVLPWGQMSYWGAQVIINLFGAIPMIGGDLTEWIRGDYLVSDATLNRFFALHVVALPLVILLLVVLHLGALHEVGSNNPDGVDIKKLKDKTTGIPLDGIAFHPYYTVKDTFGAAFFLTIAAFILFFIPDPGRAVPGARQLRAGQSDGDAAAHQAGLVLHARTTRCCARFPDKLLGVMTMGGAVMILFLLPWLDRSPVKSIRYRSMLSKVMIALFVVAFVSLGYLGTQAGSTTQTMVARGPDAVLLRILRHSCRSGRALARPSRCLSG